MEWYDWSIVIAVMVFVTYTALTTKKYTKSIADFLVANRCAGRYLVGIAQHEAGLGAIGVVLTFEMFYMIGFIRNYWMGFLAPISVFIILSGWVLYRFRATRAMTLAQFFEMRYSRNFRIFAGILGAVSGVINFGIFPAVGARFFMHFCGFTKYITYIGPLEINLTLAAIMLILIGLSIFFIFIGGQIAVLVTDFWQGLIASVAFAAIVGFLWFKFPWSQISEALIIASKPGQSLIDPFNIDSQKDFNFFFFAILWFLTLYNHMAWQGTQGFNSSALTPHEAKMGVVVGGIRAQIIGIGLMLIPLVAITYMNHPDFANGAKIVSGQLHEAYAGNETLQRQMIVPITMTHFIPTGLIGAFAAAMLGFFICTNNSYMHSWGSIIVQDVICPFRKTPFTQKQHMRCLKASILGVAIFSFFFSLLFPLTDYIWMFQKGFYRCGLDCDDPGINSCGIIYSVKNYLALCAIPSQMDSGVSP
jgi:SSS family solute:Na+ symporter